MNKERVIISAIAGDIGQSIAKALKGRYDLIGCDMLDFEPYHLFVDHKVKLPSAKDAQAYLDSVQDMCHQWQAQYFIPVSEPEIMLLNRHRSLIKKMKTHVIINNEQVIALGDKLTYGQFLMSLGLNVPQTTLLTEINPDQFHKEYIIKPRWGCGSRQIKRAKGSDDIMFWQKKHPVDFIAQEYIPAEDDEYTTAVFSDGQKTEVIILKRQIGFGGLSRLVEIRQDKTLQDGVINLAKAICLKGSINIQSRFYQGKHWIFEINPRFSSTVLLRKHFGFDDANWWLQVASQKEWVCAPRPSQGTAYRLLTEYFGTVS